MSDHRPPLPDACLQWRKEVDRLLLKGWCIDTAAAGMSETETLTYWEWGERPEAFVAWFVEKYDLTALPDDYR